MIGEFGADPVKRHLDPDHVRVGRRLLQEQLDRRERVERVMDEEVLLADIVEHAGIALRRPTTSAATNGVSFKCGSGRRCNAIQSAKSSRSFVRDDDVVPDLEVVDAGS